MPEPMFPTATAMAAWRLARLGELEETLAHERQELADCIRDCRRVNVLLAEEEDRTEALEAALHALVDGEQGVIVEGFDLPNGPSCLYCGGDDWDQGRRDVTHTADCPAAKARALLKGEGQDEQRPG